MGIGHGEHKKKRLREAYRNDILNTRAGGLAVLLSLSPGMLLRDTRYAELFSPFLSSVDRNRGLVFSMRFQY